MEEIIENIKNKLLQEIDCETIILFGSFARGTQNEKSDIDIAFLTQKQVSKKEIFDLKQKLEDTAKRDIDLVDMNNDIGDGFKYEIITNGKILYCKDEVKFDLYKIRVISDFLETNEARQTVIDRIKNGGSIYGK